MPRVLPAQRPTVPGSSLWISQRCRGAGCPASNPGAVSANGGRVHLGRWRYPSYWLTDFVTSAGRCCSLGRLLRLPSQRRAALWISQRCRGAGCPASNPGGCGCQRLPAQGQRGALSLVLAAHRRRVGWLPTSAALVALGAAGWARRARWIIQRKQMVPERRGLNPARCLSTVAGCPGVAGNLNPSTR